MFVPSLAWQIVAFLSNAGGKERVLTGQAFRVCMSIGTKFDSSPVLGSREAMILSALLI